MFFRIPNILGFQFIFLLHMENIIYVQRKSELKDIIIISNIITVLLHIRIYNIFIKF